MLKKALNNTINRTVVYIYRIDTGISSLDFDQAISAFPYTANAYSA